MAQNRLLQFKTLHDNQILLSSCSHPKLYNSVFQFLSSTCSYSIKPVYSTCTNVICYIPHSEVFDIGPLQRVMLLAIINYTISNDLSISYGQLSYRILNIIHMPEEWSPFMFTLYMHHQCPLGCMVQPNTKPEESGECFKGKGIKYTSREIPWRMSFTIVLYNNFRIKHEDS